MSSIGKPLAIALGAVVLSGTIMVPYAYALAQDYVSQPAPIVAPAVVQQEAQPEAQAPIVADQNDTPAPAPATTRLSQAAPDAELNCLAKVIVHEAGNQPRAGQLAVAQVVMNRVRSGRFASTICGVVMQRGQFFNVHAYNPPRDGRWRLAMELARDAREGISEPVIGNALFFRAAYSSGSFGNRRQVGRIGAHLFYR
jgi:spore germination cell wall hydrolase CwlJ-like protein